MIRFFGAKLGFVFASILMFSSSAIAKPLLVVTEFSPPYQTLTNDKVGGQATDVVRKILDAANLDYKIEMYPWARAYNFASNRNDVLIYSIAKTPERLAHFHWIAPVYEFKPYFVGLKSRSELSLRNMEDAKGYIVAVQRLDFAHKYLESVGFEEGKNLVLTRSIVDSWHLLKNGKVDFVVDDLTYELQANGETLETNKYRKFVPIKALHQTTYLAANIDMPENVIRRLQKAAKNVKSF